MTVSFLKQSQQAGHSCSNPGKFSTYSSEPSVDGKIVVIKFGGNAIGNEEIINRLIDETTDLINAGARVIVVHGGGTAVNDALAAIGKKTEKVNGLRVTDGETLEIAVDTFQSLNKRLTDRFLDNGVSALGFCRTSLSPFVTKKMAPIERLGLKIDLGWVGEITNVDLGALESWLWAGWLPVIAPLGTDADNHYYNINADHAALAIAGALEADALLFLTDVPGVLTELGDPSSRITNLTPEEALACIEHGIVSGGMLPKLKSCVAALSAGVEKIAILSSADTESLIDVVSSPTYSSGTLMTRRADAA